MAIWRKPLQFINVMLANRSPMSVAERGPGRMTYAKKKKPFAEHDLRVTLECAGKKSHGTKITSESVGLDRVSHASHSFWKKSNNVTDVLLVFRHRPCPTMAVLRGISYCFHRCHRIGGMFERLA